MLVARALPAGLGAAAKCKRYSLTGPNPQKLLTGIINLYVASYLRPWLYSSLCYDSGLPIHESS